MELLSPAGSFEALKAAVSAGCDAVYMGSSEFANARMNAANFDNAMLSNAIDYCKLRGVKSYITVNTLLTDRELGKLFDYAVFLHEAGADAVIVQDLGVANFLHKNIPNLSIHASTQMGICNLDGVRFAEKIGCTRAVVARELSKENIDYICKNTTIETEVFVHGAICSCCSGFCLMSSFIGRRSGNRGKCAQPCRMPYSVSGKEGYYMSLKDMMLIGHIDELKSLGVTSLKLEGRMKGAGYVGTVTESYRKAIDGEKLTDKDIKRLTSVFDRGGYTDGYYVGTKDLFAVNKPETTYGDKEYTAPEKRVGIKLSAFAKIGEPIRIIASLGEKSFEAVGTFVCEKALKREVTEADFESKINKLGETAFFAKELEFEIEGGLMVPLGEISSVRRDACAGLESLILNKIKFSGSPSFSEIQEFKNYGDFRVSASVSTIEQYEASKNCDEIFVPLSLINNNRNVFEKFDEKVTVSLPKINHDSEREKLRKMLKDVTDLGYTRLSASNYGDIEGFDIKHSDYSLWAYNSKTVEALKALGIKRAALSPEMNIAQLKSIKTSLPCEAIVYGKLPLMVSKNCFAKNSGHCGDCAISDRTGMTFPTRCDKDFDCYEVLNSVPIYMLDKLEEFEGTAVDTLRLIFTTESMIECTEVLENVKTKKPFGSEFTRGHYYRGV